MWLILAFLICIFGLRNLGAHLQSWQLREYRFDRMRAWLRTDDGKDFFTHFWFFPGIFPRPKISLRIILILGCVVVQSLFVGFWVGEMSLLVGFIIWERTLWWQVVVGVFISGIPVRYQQQKLFGAAKQVVDQAPDIIRIGITGSYGKSSTKELLVHLLEAEFGAENVLYNPANNNNEVAIARLILARKDFFQPSSQPKFFVCEVGAYKKGEIAGVCTFLQPQHTIITAVSDQHLDLFGSLEALSEAKFEMAQAAGEKTFYNADSPALAQAFTHHTIKATPIGISTQNIKYTAHFDATDFRAFGQDFHLPWPGVFFINNALLALELTRELGVKAEKLSVYLKTLEPLDRALNIKTTESGFRVLEDLYSANTQGVLGAIAHLGHTKGRKIFVGLPLRELGEVSLEVHEKIFSALKVLEAEVFWCKSDFAALGATILGDQFHLINEDREPLKVTLQNLTPKDTVLLESKLPQEVLRLFRYR